MSEQRLFEVEAPRPTVRRGRPAAVAMDPHATANPVTADPIGAGVRAAAGPIPGPWVLEIPAPTINRRDKKTKLLKPAPGWLTMNDRMYRRQRDNLVAEWRKAATLLARHLHMPVGVVTRARFDAVLHFTSTVRRDPVNWHPTVKPVLDALTKGTRTHPGYGFLPDDSPAFLHCEDCPHLRIDKTLLPKKPFGPMGLLVLTITALDANDLPLNYHERHL